MRTIAGTLARTLLPDDHRLYLSWHRHRFGVLSALASAVELAARRGQLVSAPVPGSRGIRVFTRPGTADQSVFDEVFFDGEYAMPAGRDLETIIDAGAHIGLASVYFALGHPRARIVALEPEGANHALLVRNTRAVPNVHAIAAALWSHRSRLAIANPGADTWAFRVAETSGHGIEGLGVDDVMGQYGLPHVDLLKIDIEGAEVEVFETADAWIDRVDTIVVELHDRFRPGCTAAVERALRAHAFTRTVAGEKIVFTRHGHGATLRPTA